MLNNNDTIRYLQTLGLSRDEAMLYLALLKGARSHLELARATGINRTKVYRLADDLEKRSLISSQTDDSGTLLVAGDPSTLEVELVNREESLKNQRAVFSKLLPSLEQTKLVASTKFSVQTYEGVEGFKQMLWHELKAKDEVLIFGSGALENLVSNKRWAEKHRAMTVDANYIVRELQNPGSKSPDFTKNPEFLKKYNYRELDEKILLMKQQVVIYNNTVATYHWRDDQKVGVEIIDASHTDMMRQLFETYWKLAATC